MLVSKRAEELHPGDLLKIGLGSRPVQVLTVVHNGNHVYVQATSPFPYYGSFHKDMLVEVLV